jgi:phosphate transport system protein
MGGEVERMIGSSVQALVERDSDLARRLIEYDNEIDRLELASDERCLRILARRQPVASDLRMITIAMKMVTDLERIGDLCVNICERVIELNAEPPLKPYTDLVQMSELVRRMIRDALDAFVKGATDKAQAVIERDQSVDLYHEQIFRELLLYMMEDVHNVHRGTRVQAISKYLERIGDHATNLAEMVVFRVKGQDIRHHGAAATAMPAASATRTATAPVATGASGAAVLGAAGPRGVLFACVHNSVRSQMAEGLARAILPRTVNVWSAGSAPADGVNPYAIEVMREIGIDISGQRPKRFADVPLAEVGTIVTLCAEECVVAPHHEARVLVWTMEDPGIVTGTEEEKLAAFRAARDELRERIKTLRQA